MDINDRDLIDKAKAGDIKSLENLLKKYNHKIAQIARYVCVNAPFDADDVHNETMISVFKNIKGFKFKSNFSTWFYRIAANHCWMKFRNRKREKLVSVEDMNPVTYYEKARDAEISHDFYKILSRLSIDFRMTLILVDIKGFSLKEVASELGITVAALKSRLFRARNMFKKEVEKEERKNIK